MIKKTIKRVIIGFVLLVGFTLLLFNSDVHGNKQSNVSPIAATTVSNKERKEVLVKRVKSDLQIEANCEFLLADHFEVQSNLYGNVTSQAKLSRAIDTTKLGKQKVEVTIKDHEGYYYYQTLVFSIRDTIPPTINTTDSTIILGDFFDPLTDVTASDAVDGDLTNQLEVTSELKGDQVGEYLIHYQVYDKSNNLREHTRKVSVIDNQPSPDNLSDVAPEVVLEDIPEPYIKEPVVIEQPTTEASIVPQRIKFLDYDIPYENGGMSVGQSIIDSRDVASTWGGNSYQSGNDKGNTHFIGHNPGVFAPLFSLYLGAEISISDGEGQVSVYKVTNLFQVDSCAVGISDGVDYWDVITGSGGGERVTLQTCVSDTANLIVQAAEVK